MQLKITKPIAELRQDAIRQVNTLAGDKIVSVYPVYKQANMTSRYLQLNNPNEQEAIAIKQAWQWIAAIRDTSNMVCVAITQANDMANIRALVASYSADLSALQPL
jgi:hypothetical protein